MFNKKETAVLFLLLIISSAHGLPVRLDALCARKSIATLASLGRLRGAILNYSTYSCKRKIEELKGAFAVEIGEECKKAQARVAQAYAEKQKAFEEIIKCVMLSKCGRRASKKSQRFTYNPGQGDFCQTCPAHNYPYDASKIKHLILERSNLENQNKK